MSWSKRPCFFCSPFRFLQVVFTSQLLSGLGLHKKTQQVKVNIEGMSLGGLKLDPCLRLSDSKTWLHHEGSLSPTIPSLLVIPRRCYPVPPPSITGRRSSESHGGLGRQKMSRFPGRSGLGPPGIAESFLLHSPFALSAHIPADHRRFPQSGLGCGVLGKTFAPVQMVGFRLFHFPPILGVSAILKQGRQASLLLCACREPDLRTLLTKQLNPFMLWWGELRPLRHHVCHHEK